jgi:hypothetical protein
VTARHARRRRDVRLWVRWAVVAGVLAAVAILLFVPGVQPGASATGNPVAGSQGTVSSLTDTSPVTVSGRGAFSTLQVTVNQTKNLGNQAISVSWTGGTPTYSDATTGAFDSTFDGDYLQIFECWGDPDPSDPLYSVDPGPSPTQCEFGGESPTPTTSYPIDSGDVGFQYSRVLSTPGWSTYSQTTGYLDNGTNGTNFIIEPFDSVDGTVVNQQANYDYLQNPLAPQPFWENAYFSFEDTNEIDFARTYADGTGDQVFQVDTGLEAPGLGCGQAIQTLPDGTQKVPQCWLVVVPRGTAAQENPTGLTGVTGVMTSPLTSAAWANRIAIPLTFKPVATSCALGGNEERIVGSELATTAVSSWQPALCAKPGAPPYNYSYVSDDEARQDIVAPTYGAAGMAVFTDPINPSQTTASNPVVYAPLTLSGVVVGFNIERYPALVGSSLQPDEEALAGTRIQNIYLTPRLVAKLLTESYQAQLVGITTDKSSAYTWIQSNPVSLVTDPDFLQYNPEFALLSTQQELDASTLLVEESSSDATATLWNWVLSDPAARAWLNGTPDPWGMQVNPIYSTSPTVNPSGVAFGTPVPETFPKSDPYCQNTGDTFGNPPQPASLLCMQSWSPYALTMNAAAQSTAVANDGGKTTPDPDAASADTAWSSNGPQKTGTYFMLSVTDSASAAQYGLQTASLSPAGDDVNPTFVAPDEQSLVNGEQAMVPSSVPGVLLTNPAATAADAYPLPILTYAATTPVSLDATDRQNYATFLQYAAGAGQTPGEGIGQLPEGYAPLPAALQAQTVAAATAILNAPVPAATPTAPASSGVTPSAPRAATVSSSAGEPHTTPQVVPTTTAPTLSAAVHLSKGPTNFATTRTSPFGAGATRWALPLCLIVGLVAFLAAPLVSGMGRRRSPVRGRPFPPSKTTVGEQ